MARKLIENEFCNTPHPPKKRGGLKKMLVKNEEEKINSSKLSELAKNWIKKNFRIYLPPTCSHVMLKIFFIWWQILTMVTHSTYIWRIHVWILCDSWVPPSWCPILHFLRTLFHDDWLSHWLHPYLTPLCWVCLCCLKWPCCVAWYSHWMHKYSKHSCLDSVGCSYSWHKV